MSKGSRPKGIPAGAFEKEVTPGNRTSSTTPGGAELTPSLGTAPMSIWLNLDRYVIHKEDDGPGGAGVDLYMGYLASGTAAVNGTTAVSGGLSDSNGGQNGQPRNSHEVAQSLFTLQLDASGQDGACGVARLHLIESDQSTAAVRQAFASAQVPTFANIPAPQFEAADVALFYLGPLGAIIKILGSANSDDDYGHWSLAFSRAGETVTCRAIELGAHCFAVPATVVLPQSGSTSLTLSYVDSDNDIDCIISLGLGTDRDSAADLQKAAAEAAARQKAAGEADARQKAAAAAAGQKLIDREP